ncbi:MAG TPA: DUF6544 family protein, partial [Acidimicrobiia bacterium]
MTLVSSNPLAPTVDTAAGAGHGRLWNRFVAEVAAAGLSAAPPGEPDVVTEADVAGLPEVVQRYLGFMGVVGRRREWSFRAKFVGRFRLRPRLGWMPAVA